ncbi:hypothetical protein RJ641_021645 [Dillenia turbinata]|uniref:Uncharacterized protein n=1 Tax=Dillenia turbinata TaxID=194707 RepID=A0AAN8YT56_9MAGN
MVSVNSSPFYCISIFSGSWKRAGTQKITREGVREIEMGEPPTAPLPSPLLDVDALRSRIKELRENASSDVEDSEMSSADSEQLLKECALHIQHRMNEIMSEWSNVSFSSSEDLDACLGTLNAKLEEVQAENCKVQNEIEVLNRTHIEESARLEGDLESLEHSLNLILSQENVKGGACTNVLKDGWDLVNSRSEYKNQEFKILDLQSKLENDKMTLKSLQDLDNIYKRFEAIERIEGALTGLKVVEFEGNTIRLSLRTYIPNLEGIMLQQKCENITEPPEVYHELLIELMDSSMDLKNAEVFPNNVYIREIIDAAKSSSSPQQPFSTLSVLLEARSSLGWFVRKVQDRIVLCTLRQIIVKYANKSRHTFEYVDKDEMIVARMVGGLDAFIKISQGWPLTSSLLKLISLKSSDSQSQKISFSILCKVEEATNSLEAQTRQNVVSFVDAIEEIVVKQMRLAFNFDEDLGK